MSAIRKHKLNNKGFSHVELVLLIVVIAVIAGVGFFVYNKNNNKSKAGTDLATPLSPMEKEADYQKLGSSSAVQPIDANTSAKIAQIASAKPKAPAKKVMPNQSQLLLLVQIRHFSGITLLLIRVS
jgi:Tfp pilus assembly protein PilE